MTVTVSSAATDLIDEIVLRWPAGLGETLRLAPFTPSEERIERAARRCARSGRSGSSGPASAASRPARSPSAGDPCFRVRRSSIALVATRVVPGPVAFDLQLLAANDLLTFDGGLPAEIRVEVP